MVITVTQLNWNGKGDDRKFNYFADWATVDAKLDKIAQAYNFDGGRTRVERDGRDITATVGELKYG